MSKPGVRISPPVNRLKEKANRPGGRSFDDLVAAGDQAIAAVGTGYKQIAVDGVDALSKLIAKLTEASHAVTSDLKGVFHITHDIRGQAGTFGYPALSATGTSLCDFIEALGRVPAAIAANRDEVVEIVNLHLRTMQIVLAHDIREMTPEIKASLVDGLERAAAKTLRKIMPAKG